MKLKNHYRFIYIPSGRGGSRTFKIPAWGLLSVGCVLISLLTGTALYLVDWQLGAAWRPGGSPLAVQNELLMRQAGRFENRLATIQSDLDKVFAYQQMVASAVDMEPLDAQVRAAGIGGRGPLQSFEERPDGRSLNDIEALLRQARIQRQGLSAILDTLTTRQQIRDRLPSIRPVDIGWISSRFGMRRDPFTGKQSFHPGMDFSVPMGTPVRTTADGVVVASEKQRGLGLLVKVDHGGGIMTVYGHLQKTRVTKGQEVARGEIIAMSGNSGRSTAPHLHYEVRIGGRVVNPLTYILDSYAQQR
jgi:murein DD-endopeptidase MepM/ murein hydrolase activator NlpD